MKTATLFFLFFLLSYSQQNLAQIKSDKMQNQDPEIWRNYNFIPGDKIIFYDDLKAEEVGEFPSRWDLLSGGSEVVRFNDENVILGTNSHNNRIKPILNTKNYLPEQFTIEFDVYVGLLSTELNSSNIRFNLFFTSKELVAGSNRSGDVTFVLTNGIIRGYLNDNNTMRMENTSLNKLNAWHHIAMSYNKGKFKMHYDGTRIFNLPKLGLTPNEFGIKMDGSTDYKATEKIIPLIKNIKIAEGGGSLYKKITTEGKFVTNGILFDSGKATLKPQSFGVINKLVGYMKDNTDWQFEIIGHTDSDGEEQKNLVLSQNRADAVKQAIIDNGIDASRITTLGKGESVSLNQNKSPEEKANNRRVEFVLKK